MNKSQELLSELTEDKKSSKLSKLLDEVESLIKSSNLDTGIGDTDIKIAKEFHAAAAKLRKTSYIKYPYGRD